MRISATEDPSDADITKFIEEAEASIVKELGSITADAMARELAAKMTALSITGPDPYTVMLGGVTLVVYPSEWMRRVEILRKMLRSGKVKATEYQTDALEDRWTDD